MKPQLPQPPQSNEDERRRREFAKAFGWILGLAGVPATPSWEEIFVQVGRLLVLEELKKKIIPTDFGQHP